MSVPQRWQALFEPHGSDLRKSALRGGSLSALRPSAIVTSHASRFKCRPGFPNAELRRAQPR